MAQVSITVDVPEEWANAADEIATNLGLSRTDIFREAISQYMASYEQETIESEEALAELRAGTTLSHEEVLQRFAAHTRTVQAA